MIQAPLFHESLAEALRTSVMALGGFKRVGADLWPELPADRAGRDLTDCLSQNSARKLSLEQVEFIFRKARMVGCHAVMHYLAQTGDYESPRPTDPETEVQRLQREFVEAQRNLAKLVDRIEAKQETANDLRRVA